MSEQLMHQGFWKIVVADDDDESTGEVDLRNCRLLAVQMPATWTAAALAFFSRPGLPKGHQGNDTPQLALVLEVSAGQYRTLTEDERSMADGLAVTSIQSILAADLPTVTGVTQAADRVIVPMGAPR